MVVTRMKRVLLSIAYPGRALRRGDFARNGGADQGRVYEWFTINRPVSIEESLTGLLAFCADVAWRALVSCRFCCPRDAGRMRPRLHAIRRRARAVAARCGGRLPQLGHRQGKRRHRQNLADRRPRHVRRGLSVEGLGARRGLGARLRRRAGAAAGIDPERQPSGAATALADLAAAAIRIASAAVCAAAQSGSPARRCRSKRPAPRR